jgi:thioredoxin reductase (NADPH)
MYDLVIIGSGPAGLSAAVYAKRACLSILVIEKEAFAGGQMVYTEEVDNYLGLNAKSGFELAESFKQHALDLDVSFAEGAVEKIVPKDGKWSLHMESGEDIETKTVLLATGATHRKLGVPGEETFAGVGVSYCATCDGAFFQGKSVAVVGGGDVALEDALYLANICEHVYLIHRRNELRGTKVLQNQVFANEKITFLGESEVTEITGDKQVSGISVHNKVTDETKELSVVGVFIAVGMEPQSDLYAPLLSLEHGYVPAGEDCATEKDGLYVAGDVRTKRLRQIVTAVADGANAVHSIQEYLML